MKRRCADQGPGLFDWSAAQPVPVEPAPEAAKPVLRRRAKIASPVEPEPTTPELAPVVDFLTKRPTLPRWILGGRRDLRAFDLWFARKEGEIPPAPIIPFGPRAGPAPYADDNALASRAG